MDRQQAQLVELLKETRARLAQPTNDYAWSSWADAAAALAEFDAHLTTLRRGEQPDLAGLDLLFAPTGPLQEVALHSGWGDGFLLLAERADKVLTALACECQSDAAAAREPARYLGLDAHLAEVTLLRCPRCGGPWLRYQHELEGVTRSGRWFLGRLSPAQAARVDLASARPLLESLRWYFCGGSYYGGRTARTAGPLDLP